MIVSVPYIPEPSLAVALAVTVPLSVAVTSPVEAFMDARLEPLVIDHVTVLFVAFEGNTDALS